MFGEQSLVEANPERREAAADRRITEIYRGELLFLGGRCKKTGKSEQNQ
jgi:hypothetical protein